MWFCSTPGCENVLNLDHAVKNKLTCVECKKDTCAKCKMVWHGNSKCKDMLQSYSTTKGRVDLHVCPKCGC